MKTSYTYLCIFLLVCISGRSFAQQLQLESQYAPKPAPPAPLIASRPPDMGLINPVALGLRLSPDGASLSAKCFVSRDWVVEAMLGGSAGFLDQPHNGPANGPSWTATLLGEYHIIFQDPSWRIYFGAGLHSGEWDKYNHREYADVQQAEGVFGADAIVGGEYLFKAVPIGISLDAKPAVNFMGYPGFFPNDMFGLGVRYYLGRKVVLRIAEPQ